MDPAIGFTASRVPHILTPDEYRKRVNAVVKRLDADTYITGVCWGGDEYIALAVRRYHPDARLIGVVPSLLRQVSSKAMEASTELIRMPPRSSYRQRNVKIVELSTRMVAFWANSRAHSGTFMTINIARRAGKIVDADIYNV